MRRDTLALEEILELCQYSWKRGRHLEQTYSFRDSKDLIFG